MAGSSREVALVDEESDFVAATISEMRGWSSIGAGRSETEAWALRSLYAAVFASVEFQPSFVFTESLCKEKFGFIEEVYAEEVELKREELAHKNMFIAEDRLRTVVTAAAEQDYHQLTWFVDSINITGSELMAAMHWANLYRVLFKECKIVLIQLVSSWPEFVRVRDLSR